MGPAARSQSKRVMDGLVEMLKQIQEMTISFQVRRMLAESCSYRCR